MGLEDKSEYSENELETRLINNLQSFLLELGTGYTFVARQKRFTFNEEHFRVDLVFYNRMLRCFVLFDLKIGSLKHQDKDDSMVELTLPKDSNIFASKYQLYLPDKKLLQDKLGEWVKECDADKCTK